MKRIDISSLIENYNNELFLRPIIEGSDLGRSIETMDVNRPGLALAGFFKNFASNRIQVFGRGECAFLNEPVTDNLINSLKTFLDFQMPALIFTHNNVPPAFFIEQAKEKNNPLFTTPLSTHDFILHFSRILGDLLAPRTSIHGVLIDVFGVGIMIMGSSGIGKSETALELIERGHCLVADDMVEIVNYEEKQLIGKSSEILEHFMELRGLGIINVRELFGIGAVSKQYPLDLVINLEEWDPYKEYERVGLEQDFVEILGVKIPMLLLPVRPGRNIPVLIETAAINHRSMQMGNHAARKLSERVDAKIKGKFK